MQWLRGLKVAMTEWTDDQAKSFYNSKEWKEKRLSILKRDNYECQDCKQKGKLTTSYDAVLEIDHIKELKEYPELKLEDSNLRTLCRTCHNIKHNRFFTGKGNGRFKRNKWVDDEKW